jgi:hypothetical protein
VAGAHGGAGTSTLAVLLAPAWDMGAIGAPGGGGLRPGGRPVVLVTRNTVAGWGRAPRTVLAPKKTGGEEGRSPAAITAVSAAAVPVTVLVVVGDGLPEPAEARYRFRVLEGRVGAVVRVPFVPAFRVASSPAQVRLPRRVRRALAEIRALAREQSRYPSPLARLQGRT